MQKSTKRPFSLCETQEWFGKTISQPLQKDHRLAISNAETYIKPSPTLTPHQRIEIYHQQYWWRLLKCLQKNFPMVTRLFGYEDFQQEIGIPYLHAYPPTHWALCRLGDMLPEWVERHYPGNDRDLVLRASKLDWTSQVAFWIGSRLPVDFAKLTPEETLSKKLTLQPYIHLFKLNGDLFSLREALLKEEVEYWNRRPFPKMESRKCTFVLYRTPKNNVAWKEISFSEFQMLSEFKEESTISEACAKIEGRRVEEELPLWFREWTYLNWFVEVL